MPIRNYCCSCGRDFASISAFDKHRTGTHQYTWREGLELDPPREDGRRCLDITEMHEADMALDSSGRWHIRRSAAEQARLATLSVPV